MENLILHFAPLATVQKFMKIALGLNVEHNKRKQRNRQTQVVLQSVPMSCYKNETDKKTKYSPQNIQLWITAS